MSDAVRHAVLGCLLGAAAGPDAPTWLLELLDEGLAGVTVFSSNIDGDYVAAVRRARPDAVVAIDEEGGDVTRLHWRHGCPLPGNAALGAVGDPAVTAEVAELTAWSVLDAGANLMLAPCVDVNTDPANPVIGARSFAADPRVAAAHAHAFVAGARRAGVATCAKHFPGHGATSVDSHLALPEVTDPWEVISERDLPPFAAAIDAGVDSVMLGHLKVACLGDAPASQNTTVVERLRGELGFTGVVVTDALDMAAVGSADTLGAAAVASLQAGCDLLCLGSGLDASQVVAAIDETAAALTDGRLDAEALRRSNDRVQVLVAAAQRRRQACGRETTARGRVEELGSAVAARAIAVRGALPALRSPLLVECRPAQAASSRDVAWGVGHLVAGRVPAAVVSIGSSDDAARVLDRYAGRPIVVVVRGLAAAPWQRSVVESAAAGAGPLVLVELGWPALDPPAADAYVVTHGASAASCRAAADLLVASARRGVGGG